MWFIRATSILSPFPMDELTEALVLDDLDELKAVAKKRRRIKTRVKKAKAKLPETPPVAVEVKRVAPFAPHEGPQLDAILADWCETLFYGGARGGGKTYYLLLDFAKDIPVHKENWHGVLFRRTYPELKDVIQQSFEIFPKCGGEWRESEKEWRFKEGSTLLFRYLDNYKDIPNYQGWNKTWLGFDELTNWPDLIAFDQLKGILRSKHPIHNKRIRATGNPGGPGHQAVKQRFIDKNVLGFLPFSDKYGERMFIPARVQDNLTMMKNDPGYISRLEQVGSPELVKAWLDGDWNAVLGAFFDVFSLERHVYPRFSPPRHWYRYRCFDWGSGAPFAVYWAAVSDGNPVDIGSGQWTFPRGARVYYKEWYGCEDGKFNKGLGLSNTELIHGIQERSDHLENKTMIWTDGLPFQARGGPTIAQEFRNSGLPLIRSDTTRETGWQKIYSGLKGNMEGEPEIYITEDCPHLIRCLPSLQRSLINHEDISNSQEDHAPDALRMGEMHFHMVKDSAVNPVEVEKALFEKALRKPSFSEMIKYNNRLRAVKARHGRFH